MEVVSFTQMENGSAEDYRFLLKLEDEFILSLPDRIISELLSMENSFSGFKVSRLEHSLQSGTRAFEAEESDEVVVAALIHDIGDMLAPLSHSEMAAAILRPFVSEKIYWIVKHHGLFQLFYYAHHVGGDRDAREKYVDHPWYSDAVRFCEEYDQKCFDPEYQSQPLEFFEPIIRRTFSVESAVRNGYKRI